MKTMNPQAPLVKSESKWRNYRIELLRSLSLAALLCALAQGAWAESVTFNVRYWDTTNKQVVTTPTTKDATVLTSYDDWVPLGANDNNDDHYYVVKGNVSIKTLNCFGRVHIILADNATLTCTGGIIVQECNNNARLFIYSQSDGDNQGKLIVTNSYSGAAGIGSTKGENNGTIEIHGGTVIAIAGEDCKGRENKGGSAIGCGQGVSDKDAGDKALQLNIADHLRVTAGNAENDIERVFSSDLRVPACRWRNYVKIEACTHTTPTEGSDKTEAKSYTIDSEQHTMHCRYCAYTLQENHTFVENVCNACGKRDNTSDDMWSVTLHRASAAGSYSYADRVVMKVVKGQTFTIPAVSATEGLTLMGYATAWTENMGIEMKDGETLTEVGTVVTPEADMNYYPRYRYRYMPTWTWNDDDATVTLSITCSALSSEAVNVGNISYTTSGDAKTAHRNKTHPLPLPIWRGVV